MPTLADIYSLIDSAKRRGSDLIRNPGASLEQMAGYGIDKANAARDQLYGTLDEGMTFGPKTRQLANQMASAYNPIGMIVPAYHGTSIAKIGMPNAKMSEMYDRTHFPGWFSENPELSNYYAVARNEGNPNIIPVNLNIKKPLKLNFDMNSKADEAYKAAQKLGLDPNFFDEIKNKNWAHEVVNTYTFKKAAQEAGYDAIQVFEDGYKTYAPLKEGGKQIKSRFE